MGSSSNRARVPLKRFEVPLIGVDTQAGLELIYDHVGIQSPGKGEPTQTKKGTIRDQRGPTRDFCVLTALREQNSECTEESEAMSLGIIVSSPKLVLPVPPNGVYGRKAHCQHP